MIEIDNGNRWILQGGLTLETLEMILTTLRERGSVLVSIHPGTQIPSLAQLALEAHSKTKKVG